MGGISFAAFLELAKSLGLPGVVLLLFWLSLKCIWKMMSQRQSETQNIIEAHRSETQEILQSYNKTLIQYQQDMQEARRMYENNVELVKDYRSVAGDLKDVVIMNTQVLTRACDAIETNQFCPAVRLEKTAKGVQE